MKYVSYVAGQAFMTILYDYPYQHYVTQIENERKLLQVWDFYRSLEKWNSTFAPYMYNILTKNPLPSSSWGSDEFILSYHKCLSIAEAIQFDFKFILQLFSFIPKCKTIFVKGGAVMVAYTNEWNWYNVQK